MRSEREKERGGQLIYWQVFGLIGDSPVKVASHFIALSFTDSGIYKTLYEPADGSPKSRAVETV